MSTRATLRQAIRDELNDNAATKLWADALLNGYIVEAIREYGRELPREASATLTVVANQEAYALPADFVRAIRVEQPNGVLRFPLTTMRTYDGTGTGFAALIDFENRVGQGGGKPGYRIWAGSILLDPIPTSAGSSEDVRLEYLAAYAEPSADGSTIATPAVDDDLLVRIAAAKALDWISTDEAKRMRFERNRGASASGQARACCDQVAAEFARRRSIVSAHTLELSE
jgi:hypothetical protein